MLVGVIQSSLKYVAKFLFSGVSEDLGLSVGHRAVEAFYLATGLLLVRARPRRRE